MVGELFARATMLLEDMATLALEGQRRDLAARRGRVLLARLSASLAALEAILSDLGAELSVTDSNAQNTPRAKRD